MFIGAVLRQNIDTKKFLELPEAKYLIPMMVAVNDCLLHDTIVSHTQTRQTVHLRDQDLDANQMQLLEAELGLLIRHQFGLIWECMELLQDLNKQAPSIVAYMTSFPELENIYNLVMAYRSPDKLRRIRSNLSFHFGIKFMEEALKTIQGHPTAVIKTVVGDNYWYEVADEAQAHLLTRPIARIVNDQSTEESATALAQEQSLALKALKHNLLSLFQSVIEHFVEPYYI